MASPSAAEAASSEDAELTEWQRRLSEKQADVRRLQDLLSKATAEKEAAKHACAAGTAAASDHMSKLRHELLAVRRLKAEAAALEPEVTEASGVEDVDAADFQDAAEKLANQLGNGRLPIAEAVLEFLEMQEELPVDEQTTSDLPPFDLPHVEEDGSSKVERIAIEVTVERRADRFHLAHRTTKTIFKSPPEKPQTEPVDPERREDLRLRLRALRHEVSKWVHQAQQLEAERPQQEAELARLKAELTHTGEILESTRRDGRRQEVEREMRSQGISVGALQAAVESGDGYRGSPSGKVPVPLFGGGHGGIEVLAERGIRERTEQRNATMSKRAQQLMGIAASQQHLIHRLEKALHKEETDLEKKEARLAYESHQQHKLKVRLKKRSDYAVAAALGVPNLKRGLSASRLAQGGGGDGADTIPEDLS